VQSFPSAPVCVNNVCQGIGTLILALTKGDMVTVQPHFEDVTGLPDLLDYGFCSIVYIIDTPIDGFCSIVYISAPPVENTVVEDLIVDVDYNQNIVEDLIVDVDYNQNIVEEVEI
jgi:hypothetical protein